MMITLESGNRRFACRAAGIAIHDGRVLLSRAEFDDFWALPGGRVEMMEPSAETLKREMREEMAAEISVGRLLWVVENFFEYRGTKCHELGLCFEMTFAPGSPALACDEFDGAGDGLLTEPGNDGVYRLYFKWFPVQALESTRLYPTFLRQGLQALPETTRHLVHVDR
jgi:ADP-ribose pyrophosphatase YjhB (NUDIX family)